MEHVPKKRVEWVDNGRMIAILLVVFVHMGVFGHIASGVGIEVVRHWMFRGEVPFFLFFAGYFLARNITWGKAVKRSLLLFVPFFLWNALYYLFLAIPAGHAGLMFENISGILGIGNIFTRDIHLFGSHAMLPIIGPSWFLRDIIVLTFLTPLFVKFKPFFAGAVVMTLVTLCCYHANTQMCDAMLAPGTCFYYILGVCASGYNLQLANRFLNCSFTPIAAAGFFLGICWGICAGLNVLAPIPFSLIGGLFGLLLIAQFGMVIERRLPKFSKVLSSCAPACFLIFMLHVPMMQIASCFLPEWFGKYALVWLIPFVICALIIAAWLGMRKWTPWLLPILAHDKMHR